MPVTVTPTAWATGAPPSVTEAAPAAGTQTVAVEPTGTWTVRAKRLP